MTAFCDDCDTQLSIENLTEYEPGTGVYDRFGSGKEPSVHLCHACKKYNRKVLGLGV